MGDSPAGRGWVSPAVLGRGAPKAIGHAGRVGARVGGEGLVRRTARVVVVVGRLGLVLNTGMGVRSGLCRPGGVDASHRVRPVDCLRVGVERSLFVSVVWHCGF